MSNGEQLDLASELDPYLPPNPCELGLTGGQGPTAQTTKSSYMVYTQRDKNSEFRKGEHPKQLDTVAPLTAG